MYQRTGGYPDDWNNGYHIMSDTEERVTVRWVNSDVTVHQLQRLAILAKYFEGIGFRHVN